MKWNQTKKRVEALLADSVRHRVEFRTTTYRRTHDQLGRGWITIDGTEILDMPSLVFDCESYWRNRETRTGYDVVEKELREQNLFSQWDLQRALVEYISLPFAEILKSDNPIIRAFGMLDTRCGKRWLSKLDMTSEHDLVKRLYTLRCSAENLREQPDDLTSRLQKRWIRDEKIGATTEEAEKTLTNRQRSSNLRTLILRLYRKGISRDELATDTAREIFDGFEGSEDRETLLKVLLRLERESKLLRSHQHVRGVIALTRNASLWVRDFEQWFPPSHNPDRQFSSLARHLWALYEIPPFFDTAWLEGNVVHQQWFRHVGSGKSIRTAEMVPVPLTKMMAHHFMSAPYTYAIDGALRWGQVLALGGDRRLADALVETELKHDFRDNDFWQGVIRFLVRNPMLDMVHVGPIIDYIRHKKYLNRIVVTDAGVAEEAGPESPDFSMKGRTAASLLRAVEEWHGRLGREIKAGNLTWKRSGIGELVFIEGNKRASNMKVWRIRELLTSQDLLAEGKALRHCVASYARSCYAGNCSIWTMDLETAEGTEKLLTIEIDPERREIRQVRGRRNRFSSEKEREVLQRWTVRENLLESYRF